MSAEETLKSRQQIIDEAIALLEAGRTTRPNSTELADSLRQAVLGTVRHFGAYKTAQHIIQEI